MQAGDALYIPEGWWHQVWSAGGGTFAINFWWESAVSSAFGGDMDRWMTVACIVSVEGSKCSSLEYACPLLGMHPFELGGDARYTVCAHFCVLPAAASTSVAWPKLWRRESASGCLRISTVLGRMTCCVL